MIPQTAEDRYALRLTAPLRVPGFAHSVLVATLGLPATEVARRLDSGFLAEGLRATQAARLQTILSVLGLPVRIDDGTGQTRIDLSVQLSVWADAPRVARRVARLLRLDPDHVSRALAGPGGLVLSDLPRAAADGLAATLRRTRGLVVLASDTATALYDIHCARPLARHESDRLAETLRLLGSEPDLLTGAVAANLTRRHRDLLLARLPDLGLLALDRSFQRFDLLLTGTTGWVTRELADFLTTRTQQPRARFETLSSAAPLTLDLSLTMAVARQFCADYAAIGLFVRPILSGWKTTA